MDEELLLQANHFVSNYKSFFSGLFKNENFVDVTLVCHDGQIAAHKVILCAGSSLFLSILKNNPHPHPLLYLRGVSIKQLSPLLQFIYKGDVRVFKKDLEMFLDTARELLIEGLVSKETETEKKETLQDKGEEDEIKCEPDNYNEYDYADTSYVDQGNSSENIKTAAAASENDLMHMDSHKVKKHHKGSTGGRLLRNPVWDYFVKLDNRSSCNTCGFSLVGYNTSSLIKHLENRHVDTFREYKKKYQIAWKEKMSHQKMYFGGFEAEKPHQNRVQGRLNKNPVHNFFTRLDSYSNCNYCPASMQGHNTTSLAKHLESHHAEQFREFREMYRLAWENKRKMMMEKRKIVPDSQDAADQQEDSIEQWNDTFEIGYTEEACGDNTDGSNNFIEWNNA